MAMGAGNSYEFMGPIYLAQNEYQISKSRGAQCMSEDNKECDIMNKIWIELD